MNLDLGMLGIQSKKGGKDKPMAQDLTMVGKWRCRSDAVDYDMRPIVQRVQTVNGFSSYLEYESAVRAVIARIQSSVSFEMSSGTEEGTSNANELMLLACELASVIEKTRVAKAMANPMWETQRLFIMQECGWSGDASDVTTDGFAEKAKRLNILHRLSGGVMGSSGGNLESPFANDGVFGSPGKYGDRKRPTPPRGPETRACFKCGEVGHIGRNCTKRHSPGAPTGNANGAGARLCHRCGQPGHVAAMCDNERQQ